MVGLVQLLTLKLGLIAESVLSLPWLPSLRNLMLAACDISDCDLRSCTQITSLEVQWTLQISRQLQLPVGDNVHLQHLVVEHALTSVQS